MAKRGNPNWGKRMTFPNTTLAMPAVTELDRVAKALKLQPHQYAGSAKLRQWAKQNLNKHYIPEQLLNLWRLHADDDKMTIRPIRPKAQESGRRKRCPPPLL